MHLSFQEVRGVLVPTFTSGKMRHVSTTTSMKPHITHVHERHCVRKKPMKEVTVVRQSERQRSIPFVSVRTLRAGHRTDEPT